MNKARAIEVNIHYFSEYYVFFPFLNVHICNHKRLTKANRCFIIDSRKVGFLFNILAEDLQ